MPLIVEKNTFVTVMEESTSLKRTKTSPPIMIESSFICTTPLVSPTGSTVSSISSELSASSCSSSQFSGCNDAGIPSATGRLVRFAKQKDQVGIEELTTVMIRNIPCKYTQHDLMEDITTITPLFNFVYLPQSKRIDGNIGYAFVNFTTPEVAQDFQERFNGFTFPKQPTSSKIADVVFAVLQGLRENIKFYKKSKVRKTDNR